MPAIPAEERLIFALDVPTVAAARALVEELGPAVRFYKIGLELAMSGAYFELLDWLVARDCRVFADLKFYDIPATVAAAVTGLARRGATFATVHGDRAIMEAAAGAKGDLGILAVTVLTSLDDRDIAEMGYGGSVADLVVQRARGARAAGCDGVICSGADAPALRKAVGDELALVCPGIRPVADRPADDQKRVVDVAQAFRNGADYIVVGRPIRNAAQPRAMAEQIQATIAMAVAA